MKKKWMAALLSAVMMVSVLSGCGNSTGASDDAENTTNVAASENTEDAETTDSGDVKYGGVLRYATASACATPGYPASCTNNGTLLYLNTAYESLTYYDEEGNIIPRLATEWTVDAEEPSITWTLREGVKFADGTDFNAEAVKVNIEEYQKAARTETSNIKSCEVIDDTHIKMVLDKPDSSAVEAIGFFVYYVSPQALQDPSSLENTTCGTGAFQLTEFENNVYAKYEKMRITGRRESHIWMVWKLRSLQKQQL